jgi:ATP-dependent Lhr-like helicase
MPDSVGVAGRRSRLAARREVARRLRQTALAMPPEARWSLTSRFAVMGGAAGPQKRAEQRARVLLARYGVVSRRAVEAEGSVWEWGPVSDALALMELRGAARRGYFVRGLPGVQYALPEAVEALRAPLDLKPDDVALLNSTDPAFVLEREGAGEGARSEVLRFTRLASTDLALWGDVPVLLSERHGEAVTAVTSHELQDAVLAAVIALRDRAVSGGSFSRRIAVFTWNGEPVLKSAGADVLARAGFSRDYPGMSYDAVRARSVLARA